MLSWTPDQTIVNFRRSDQIFAVSLSNFLVFEVGVVLKYTKKRFRVLGERRERDRIMDDGESP
jgi:hypothetical protein